MKSGKYLLAAGGLLALCALPAAANEAGTWTVYGGAGYVDPDNTPLSFIDPTTEDVAKIKVDHASSMTLGATYMFDENWAFDLLASWPFQHDVKAYDSADPQSGWFKVGDFKQMPPIVSVQYHFTTAGAFDPFIGIGLNYTRFYDEKLVQEAVDQGVDELKLKSTTGIAAQLGAHWEINQNWNVGLDVRYADIETDVMLGGPMIEEALNDSRVSIGKVKVDPFIYAVNLGYHFE